MAESGDSGADNMKHPGLTFAQAEVNYILGNSLRSVYKDLLQQPVPAHLQALLDQLEERSLSDAQE